MQFYDVAAYHVRGLVKSFAALSLDSDALLREVGITRAHVDDPEARFPEMQLLQLWLAAERCWQRPEPLSLCAGANVPFGALELIDYLVAASSTIGEGITTLARYSDLCASGFGYEIAQVQGGVEAGGSEREPNEEAMVRIRLTHRESLELVPRAVIEYLWTVLIVRFREYGDPRFRPQLCLRGVGRAPEQAYRRVLGEVRFDWEADELYIPCAQWSLPNPRRDPMLATLLARHASDVLSRVAHTDDFLGSVRIAIADALRLGDVGIELTASRLALTPRTLQRRLTEEGKIYKQLVEEVRCELAETYLTRTKLSLLEVSELLAYSDQTAFQRAFRRWTTLTPAAYRRLHHGGERS